MTRKRKSDKEIIADFQKRILHTMTKTKDGKIRIDFVILPKERSVGGAKRHHHGSKKKLERNR